MKKRNVLINNTAFTLLEAIMGLFILGVIMFLLLALVNVMNKNNVNNYFLRNIASLRMEMQSDLLCASKLEVKEDELILSPIGQNDKVVYKCHNNSLIRRVNNLGVEKIISNVDSCKIIENDTSTMIKLEKGPIKREIYINII